MHAIARRTVRPATRLPARFVAGRRHARRFHAQGSYLLPRRSGPYEPAESALDQAAANKTSKENGDPVNTTRSAGEIERASQHEGPRRIVEALHSRLTEREGRGALKLDKLPPVFIPDWFLRKNVKLAEEPVEDRPSASHNCSLSVRNKKNNTLLATVSVPVTSGHGQRAFNEARTWASPTSPEGGESQAEETSTWLPPFWILAEIQAAISASLSISRMGHLPFPAVRSNLVLHSPIDGGIPFLSDLVEDVATEIGADVIQIDAQDIAEIGADYLGDSQEPAFQSIRTLGFDTHKSPPPEEVLDGFNEDIDEESQNEMSSTPLITLFDTRDLRNNRTRMRDIQQSIRHDLQGFGNFPIYRHVEPPPPPPPPPPPNIDHILRGMPGTRNLRQEDMKLSFLLAALAESNELKRASERLIRKPGNKDSDFFTDTCPTEAMEMDVASVINDAGASECGTSFEFSPKKETPESVVKDVRNRKTILLVQDFKEMFNTLVGRAVLVKLAEIVMERRKNGQNIMVVGLTSAEDLLPDLTSTAVRAIQSEHEDGPYRTILVLPFGMDPKSDKGATEGAPAKTYKDAKHVQEAISSSEVVPAPAAAESDSWEIARRERTEEINLRHIRDMLKRIDPSVAESVQDVGSHAFLKNFNAKNRAALQRAWSHEETHRVCMTALGLRPTKIPTAESVAHQVNLAMTILRLSDASKFAWVAAQRQIEKELASDSDLASDPRKESSEQRREFIKTIKSSCNEHEKKLLSGVIDKNSIRTTFEDVHAPAESVESLKTLTSLSLLRPDAFKYGVLATDKIPGLLLYGPPGTGKTLLAKAVARESGATVLEVSGSEVNDMYVGEGEKNVKAIFTLARKLSPCVVFIDEADAIFRSRSGSGSRATHREVINQFLREWDGMDDLSVFIMVATNRPFDLDDAVLRRLPRRLLVDLPTEEDRQAILKIHLKDERVESDVSLPELAARTPFYSGSDLKNLSVAAALACVREENELAASTIKGQGLAEGAYKYPEKRRLGRRHFENAIQEISASISEDMSSLTAIKKFDEQYGDRRGRRKKSGWGFVPAGGPSEPKEDVARVRA